MERSSSFLAHIGRPLSTASYYEAPAILPSHFFSLILWWFAGCTENLLTSFTRQADHRQADAQQLSEHGPLRKESERDHVGRTTKGACLRRLKIQLVAACILNSFTEPPTARRTRGFGQFQVWYLVRQGRTDLRRRHVQ